jgi:hypothetical protein
MKNEEAIVANHCTGVEKYEGQGYLSMLVSGLRSVIAEMKQGGKPGMPLGSRELSCAITNAEQGLHWLYELQAIKDEASK